MSNDEYLFTFQCYRKKWVDIQIKRMQMFIFPKKKVEDVEGTKYKNFEVGSNMETKTKLEIT